ncbi:putative lysozyme-like protein [Sitophilus oryzae]|uniref:Lysozyme-like protein n=1 Tax=Sitophilus oryzae TaxID=7048 RepID=A0A6J2YXX4_SITOR|nr:putative lysozyme-like protein [Sitophilus oryzae]
MKPYSAIIVFAFCILGALGSEELSGTFGSVRDAFHIYSECKHSDGLVPCLKMKALKLVDNLGQIENLSIIEGVEIKGKPEEASASNQSTIEEVEKTLPRSLDAKSDALSKILVDRIARMIGSKSIEISIPKVMESARKGGDDSDKFGDIGDLFGGGGGGGHGGGGGGGGGGKKKGGKKKGGDSGLKELLMQIVAKKIALIPLFIAGLFVLALKALTDAKVALLIAGIIFAKKLIAQKHAGGSTQHVSAGWSSGGGGGGGWNSGGWSGGSGGWDRRSIEAQKLAYKAQKQA